MRSQARTAAWALLLLVPIVAFADAPENSPEGNRSFSPEELVEKIRPSLVTVRSRDRDGVQNRLGTGFIVDSAGIIATNLHVIGEGRPFSVETASGDELKVLSIEASDHALDLALIRVALDGRRELPSLSLSDERVTQGTPVVAMGNPLGLEKSVVSGVVSAFRNLAGQEVIQLAMPIEPGNSGSPVVDRKGRVVGIVSMKSAIEQSVAFAVQATALRTLIDQPNPVAISHWLSIGALSSDEWTAKFGSTWTQRRGRIFVSGSGRGFGGRSLCLSKVTLPELPFEMAVSVKLDNESGAAGLVFHSDGNNKHYGFYPSNGRLRLSCFRGPTVYSWQVLRDDPCDFYRPGDWNELKVRVDSERVTCFVNHQIVFESNDRSFTSGQVGLAKFRNTVAEFKNFRIGRNLTDEALPTDLLARVAESIDELPSVEDVTAGQVAALAKTAAASMQVLRQQSQQLERQAGELQQQAEDRRRLASDVHVLSIAEKISKLVHDEDVVDLLRGSLLIAQLEQEEINVESYVKVVDQMAMQVRQSLPEGETSERELLTALSDFLFVKRGYHGSRFDYYHRANSFMNRVIDEREGLPITLSVLFMEVGRRLGLQVEGVGLPGHFVARVVPQQGEPILIDVFDRGKQLSRDDAAELVRASTGETLTDDHLLASSNPDVMLRMLVNLYGVAERDSDRESMLRFLEGIVAVNPQSVQYRGLRAVLRRATGRFGSAIEDLDWMLETQPAEIDLDRIRQMREAFQANRPQ